MNKQIRYIVLLALLLPVLFATALVVGSVSIPLADVVGALCGNEEVKDTWRYIVTESRLPQALTAMLCGASLAVCGLLLQTVFRNPLADASILGISGGAGVGVACVMMLVGGSFSSLLYTFGGFVGVVVAAFLGAMVITLLLLSMSMFVRSNAMLLIVGIMIGYLASSFITLSYFVATEEGMRRYTLWGMGSFSGVAMSQMWLFASIVLLALLASILFVKPLNALNLGSIYAESLGINVRRTRAWLLVVVGLLTAVSTAFCGPVAFIGLAVPHLVRMLLQVSDHRFLLPASAIMGAIVALACHLCCLIPGGGTALPINAVTPLVGAPVVIYVILKQKTN